MGGAVSGLIGGATSLVGGLLGGSKAADAAKGQAEALRAAGDRASAMAAFKPYGMSTAFGTSQFEDGKGSYTLSPQLQSLQGRLFGQLGAYDPTQLSQAAQPLYGAAGSLFNIGGQLLPTDMSRTASPEAQALAQQYYAAQQGLMPTSYQTGNTAEARAAQEQYQRYAQALAPTSFTTGATPEAQAYAERLRQTGAGYLAQSPEEARAEYMRTQQAALAPGRAAEEARLATTNFGRGTGGLGVQTGTGTAPSNPLAQAMYNARAMQDLQLATQAEQAAQQRQTLGLGMLGQGLTAQQQSEATQRANMLQNLGLSAGFTGQALTTQQQDAATQRSNMLENLRLSLGLGTQGLATGTTAEERARARYAEDLRMGAGLFGTGGALLGQVPALTSQAYSPLQTQLGLLSTTEAMGQQPYKMSIDLANQYAQAGANQGRLYLSPQEAAAQSYARYQGYSPMAAGLAGAGSALSGMSGMSAGAGWFGDLIGGGKGMGLLNSSPTSAAYMSNIGATSSGPLSSSNPYANESWM